MSIENQLARLMRDTMKDIQVECDDQLQENFRREAFFNDKWQRRSHDDGSGRKVLQGPAKGGVHLSQSIFPGRLDGFKLVYSTTLPYAAIHNEGGTIRVTAKMKRYFWAKYIEATGSITYKKDGRKRNTQRNRKLDANAEFYKAMALKKVGSKIIIPKRQFIGMHPQLNTTITEIIQDNLNDFFENELPNYIENRR